MPTPAIQSFATPSHSSFFEEDEEEELIAPSVPSMVAPRLNGRPRLSEMASALSQGKPAPLSKHATTGNLFASVLTKHQSQSRTTTYHARYHEEEIASDSDSDQEVNYRYENDCYSSSEQFSDDDLSSSSSESDSDYSSSDDETLEEHMHHKGMRRSTSLPMTSYCHRMPKMLDFARLKISIAAEPVQGQGKSDVDSIEI
jgi:hypothetical protein